MGRAPVGVVARAKLGVSGNGSAVRTLDVEGVADRRPSTLLRGVVGRAIDPTPRGVVGRCRTIEGVGGVGVATPSVGVLARRDAALDGRTISLERRQLSIIPRAQTDPDGTGGGTGLTREGARRTLVGIRKIPEPGSHSKYRFP